MGEKFFNLISIARSSIPNQEFQKELFEFDSITVSLQPKCVNIAIKNVCKSHNDESRKKYMTFIMKAACDFNKLVVD